jgi:hypothetical protein
VARIGDQRQRMRDQAKYDLRHDQSGVKHYADGESLVEIFEHMAMPQAMSVRMVVIIFIMTVMVVMTGMMIVIVSVRMPLLRHADPA